MKDFSRSQAVTYTVGPKCGKISETVPDRVVVTIDHQKEMRCGLSNSGNSDDLG